MWAKYEYLCPDCDSLLEVTTAKDFDLWRPWCGCGSANIIRINKYPVTDITSNHLDSLNPLPYN
jgi:hypothetical protein